MILCATALLVPVGLAQAVPGGEGAAIASARKCKHGLVRRHGNCHRKLPPKIKAGRYGSGDVYLDVDPKARTASFHFRLYCTDPYASQYATSGPKPATGKLSGIRRGATFEKDRWDTTPAESGSGIQKTFWQMRGEFTTPTLFEGWVEFEVGTFPARLFSRPQCVDAARLHLDWQPAG